MTDPAPSSTAAPSSRFVLTSDCAAFLLLRLFLGLRALMSGIEKFELGGQYSFENYSTTMSRMATGITGASFLPLWSTKLFAFPLGYVFLVLGAALLLGLKTRITLMVMGLVYVGLGFGLMAVQESQGVAWIGIYIALVFGALLTVRHNRWAVWPDKHHDV